MAVPSSGSIRMAGLAAEKDDQEDYNDFDYDDVLSLKDITLGGNAGGNHFVVDATNGFSASHPDNIAPYKMSEFYSYDHDAAAPACNLAYHNGGQGTYNYPISLGTGTGTVTIEYEAYGVPDKFVFTWNGNTYTSGSGNGNGAGFVGSQSHLSALQATPGNANATITSLTTYSSAGRGTITFNKNSSVSVSNMQVSAPLNGTAWWFSVSCPGQQVIGGGSGVAPTVTTVSEAGVGSTGFTMRATLSSLGLASNFSTTGTVTARGFVYKTGHVNSAFTIGGTGVTNELVDTENLTGSFSKSLTGLSSSTTYTYRAYATNSAGTTYGANEQAATTAASTTPSVTTNNASSITANSMRLNGNLTSTGGATVTAKGFVRSSGLITNPQLGGMGVTNVSVGTNVNTTGTYQGFTSSLSANTTYYIRAYATNVNGTSYGVVKSATTTQNWITRYVSGPHQKAVFACGQEINQTIKYVGTFGNGTTLYDGNTNLINSTNGGNKWYGGPPNSASGMASSSAYFYVNGSGVVSNYTTEGC